ncbi:MAG: hypothetical protein R2883_05245 [Caldisericia bacterium]
MNKCRSCGRMLKADEQGKDFCKHCVDENGKLKTYDEVASNLASYLMETQGLDERASANAAKAIVSSQPVWEKKQGVYFEGDMKRKRRTIVTLVVVFALILTGVGIGVFVFDKPEEQVAESKLFDDKEKNYVITHEIDGHKTYELDLPGYQSNPMVIHATSEWNNKKADAFIFASEDENNDGLYDLYRYKIMEDKMYGRFVETDKLTSPKIHKNNENIFINTDGEPKNSVLSIYNVFFAKENCFYISDDYPIAKPYPQNLSIIAEQMLENSNTKINDDYIMWCEYDEKSSSQSIYLRNFDTMRTTLIADTSAPYTKPVLLSNYVIWEDNRNIGSNTCAIYCYNIGERFEKKIHQNEDHVRLIDSKNENFFLYFTYPQDGKHYDADYTLNIFDLKKFEIVESFNDNFPIGGVYHGGNINQSSFPNIFISDDPKNPIVTWGINKKIESYDPDNPRKKREVLDEREGVAILKLGIDKEPFIIEKIEEFSLLHPLAVSDEYIVLAEEGEILIAKILENKEQPQLIKLSAFFGFIHYSNIEVKIDKDFIFWDFPKMEKFEGNEYDSGTYHRYVGSNICWARLSEIFPDDELAGAM